MQACGPLTSTIWGVTRALFAVRTLPSFPVRPPETWRRFRDELFRKRFTLDGMLSEGFTLLEERPGEELVLGTVGRHSTTTKKTHARRGSGLRSLA